MNWTKQQIADELKTLPSWNKPIYVWPPVRQALEDLSNRELFKQATRLCMSVGAGAYPVQESVIDIQADLIKQPIESNHFFNPNWVQWCISSTPYHYAKDWLGIAGADDPYEWGEAHNADLGLFQTGLQTVLNRIKSKTPNNKVGLVLLDTETSALEYNGEYEHDTYVKAKYNTVYNLTKNICQSILGYKPKIVWYAHHYSYLRNGVWTNQAGTVVPIGVPPKASGDSGSVPIYQLQDPFLCVEMFNKSLALANSRGVSHTMPIFSLNAGDCRNFHQWIQCWNFENEKIYDYLNDWLMGRYMMFGDFHGKDDGGQFAKAQYGMFWPGHCHPSFKYWALHFLAFAYGANNTHIIPEGNPDW